MRVGLLIITHGDIGQSLLDTAVAVLGTCPLQTRTLSVPMASDTEAVEAEARRHVAELDRGDGVLVLTDLFGSTPSNIACRLRADRVAVVAGTNLPMLVRVLNYPELDLPSLVEKAVSGGQDGVVCCTPSRNGGKT
ncbi:MAG TPA: PTS sugar transporter subunit IIA [Gammaproteobacteria bacterium]|nr:PTS sugar transporter subunit IIA [Gammaproteobacteria bacterium]